MYRFRKVQFYLIFSISIFTSNIAYSGLFDDLTQILKKEVGKALKKPADRVDDEHSQSVDSSRNPLIEVQDLLNQLGYDAGPANGRFGEKTALAIEAFKRDHNMHVDGQITESLIIALRNANNPDRVDHGSSRTVQFDTPRTMPGSTNFDNAPEPDYRTLFKMYMASQGDILDTEALALEYHLLFRVEPGLLNKGGVLLQSEECKEITNIYQSNIEFEIEDLIDRIRPPFTQALLDAQDWPKTKVFRLKGIVDFGKYDRGKRKFPIIRISATKKFTKLGQQCVDRNSGSNPPCRAINSSQMLFDGLGKITLALSGLEKIKSLPMEEARAESFLKKFKKDYRGRILKELDIEVLVQVGPVPFYTELRRMDFKRGGGIPARITTARLLYPEDGRVLHTYNTSLFEPAVAETTSGTKAYNLAAPDDAVPLTTLSATILTLRDHPQLIEDDWALELIKKQIANEQWLWKDIDKFLAGFRKRPTANSYKTINKKRPAFIYEWQTLVKEQPNLANGPVLDVFWQPDPDWSFVKQEKEWDDRLEAIVSVFLFSRDKIIEGRDPEFLARELLPVWKRHLEAILAKKPPERMRMSGFFPEPKYDFDTQSLQLPNYNKKTGKSYLFTPIVFPDSSLRNIVLPQSVRTSVLYRSVYGKHPELKTTSPGNLMEYHYGHYYSPDTWRSIARRYTSMKQVLALDRRLVLASIPVAASKAEDLLGRISRARQHARQKRKGDYSIEARLIFEPVRTELGTVVQQYPIHKKGTTKPSPILFGRVIRVDLLMADGQLITSLGPDDFPSAEETHTAAVAKAKTEQRPAQRMKTMIEEKLKECEALTSAEDRLQCLEKLRESGLLEDYGKELKKLGLKKDYELGARLAEMMRNERIEQKGERKQKRQMDKALNKARHRCEQKLNKPWAPRRGTIEFEEAVSNCLKAPKREAYGPDIVGLRLGMEKNEAQDIVQKRMENRLPGVMLKETRPFENGTLSYTDDASRGIALFSIMNHGRDLVAAVSRRVYFGDNGPTSNQIIEGLRKKYGTETWSDSKKTMAWAFPTGSKHLSKKKYSGLVELIVPRDNWWRKWAPRLTDQERIQAMQKKQEEKDAKWKAYEKCMMEATMKAEPYSHNNTKYMKIYNKEMEICKEKHGNVLINSFQTQSIEEARLPLMIGQEGDPETYAKYENCGPVIIVLLNTDKEDKVKDASFVLFDPAWIADQPAFAFKSKKSDSKAMIDF